MLNKYKLSNISPNRFANSESAELNSAITIKAITIVKNTAFTILCFSFEPSSFSFGNIKLIPF